MRCTSCGAELPEGTTFCTSCGAKVATAQPTQPSYDPNQNFQQPVNSNQNTYAGYNQPYQQQIQPMTMQQFPQMTTMEDTTPISPWGYIGYNILFSIPIVGLVMLFVYSFGSNTNVNLKNYARSFLLMMLIVVIIYVVIAIFFGAVIAGVANSVN